MPLTFLNSPSPVPGVDRTGGTASSQACTVAQAGHWAGSSRNTGTGDSRYRTRTLITWSDYHPGPRQSGGPTQTDEASVCSHRPPLQYASLPRPGRRQELTGATALPFRGKIGNPTRYKTSTLDHSRGSGRLGIKRSRPSRRHGPWAFRASGTGFRLHRPSRASEAEGSPLGPPCSPTPRPRRRMVSPRRSIGCSRRHIPRL